MGDTPGCRRGLTGMSPYPNGDGPGALRLIHVTRSPVSLMLPSLMNREVLDRWCELGILGLVLAALIFGPLAFGAVPVPAFLVIQALTLGVLVLWGLRLWLQPKPQFLWPPICWAVAAFVLYAVVRYLTADIEYVARQELINVLVYAALFLAILNNLHRQESTQAISFVLVSVAMGIACYAIYQFITGSSKIWYFVNKWYPHRATGTYVCPNNLGGFLEMVLPLGLAYTLTSRVKPLGKVLLGYASLTIMAGIVVTLSRGSWVATALSLVVFFGVLLFQRGHRLASLALLALILAGGLLILPRSFAFQSRLKQVGVPTVAKGDTRAALWRSALQIWHENIIWGVGPAHYDYRFRQYRPEAIQQRPTWVHNDILNALTDWGVVGAALIAAAWGLLGAGVLKTWSGLRRTSNDLQGRKNSNKFAFVLGASVGLLAILAHSVCDFNMHIPANAIVAVTLMALLSGHLRIATERYWTRAGLWLKLAASVVLAAGLAYLGQQGWRHTKEDFYLRKEQSYLRSLQPTATPTNRVVDASIANGLIGAPLANALKAPKTDVMIDLLKKAYAVEPMNPETTCAIGECYRIQSQEGGDNYRDLAKQAMDWFDRTMKLNKWSGYGYLRYGWCLDWLERWAEAEPYFDRANELDPNGYLTEDYIGLHYIELGDYAAGKAWFERSLRLEWQDNPIATSYLQIVNTRMMEAATNEAAARPVPATTQAASKR
jgi:O-antigen ligase